MADKSDSILLNEVYPIINANLPKNMSKYKKCISDFIEARAEMLYKPAPLDRIFFGTEDAGALYKAIGIDPNAVKDSISKTYYAKIASFNPAAAKDEFTIVAMSIVRYFYLANKEKELELACIHLAFSGKFYPSIHYGSFPKVQPSEHEHVMMYVINNVLSAKYDIKAEGSVIGAIRAICNTWIKSYGKLLKSFSDEDVVYLIQQLHTRIKSFMKNIATEYYKAYEDKDLYLSYDSDSLDSDDYHIADSDSLKAERIIQKTIELMNTTGVDYKLCKMSSNDNVKTDEVKSIIETVLTDKESIGEVKELITLIVIVYFANSSTKDVRDVEFITFSIAPKPNAKDKNILRQKEIIEGWLDETSASYRKRKGRIATRNDYIKSIMTYFTLSIHNANK